MLFSESLLSQLSERVGAQMGLHFPPERWRDLEAGIQAAARESGATDVTAYARDLLAARLTQRQIDELAHALTIGETYFFRDPRSLKVLNDIVLPELIRSRRGTTRRLRIWSAGCCTGEEAYSIAIMLERLLPDFDDWQVTLLATDINARFLKKAAEGVYGEWSFRGAPDWLKEGYFKQVAPRRFAILPRIRERVTFAYLNLGQDVYPSLDTNTNAMDLILCRNVLIYFAPERAATVARNFHHALVTNGWLLVSAVETFAALREYFAANTFEGAILHRKRDAAAAALERVAAPVVAPVQEEIRRPVRQPAAVPIRREVSAKEKAVNSYEMAVALFERGRYMEAAATLAQSTGGTAPNVASATLLARIYANLGELAEARSWAERAIAADRTDAASHYLRAMILEEQNLVADAFVSLQRTLYLAPGFVLAHFALGNLTLRQGKHAESARHFSNALDFLKNYGDDAVLPDSDGMAAGRLREMIHSIAPGDLAA
jgi:chemotaxis protein methyltransferase CheR